MMKGPDTILIKYHHETLKVGDKKAICVERDGKFVERTSELTNCVYSGCCDLDMSYIY